MSRRAYGMRQSDYDNVIVDYNTNNNINNNYNNLRFADVRTNRSRDLVTHTEQ